MIDQPQRVREVADDAVPELEHPLAGVDERLEDVGDEHGLGAEGVGGTASGPPRSRPRRGSRGCSGATARRRARRPGAHRSCAQPARRTRSRRDGTCSARAEPGRSRAGRGGPARVTSERSRAARVIAQHSAPAAAGQAGLREHGPERLLDRAARRRRARARPPPAAPRSRSRARRAGPSALAQKASRSSRLTRLRSTAPPSLRPTETPSRGVVVVVRARERVDDQVAAGVRAALAVDALELAAAGQPAALAARTVGHRRLGGEPLAALVPAALQQLAARARAHARTEPVGAGALALLRLIGALHREEPGYKIDAAGQPVDFLVDRPAAAAAAGRFSRVLRERAPGPRSSAARARCTLGAPRAAAAVSPLVFLLFR